MRTAPAVSQILQLALSHHSEGRLREAEDLYRRVLQTDPDNAAAWHFLGVLAYQRGDHPSALEHIQRAIRLNKKEPAFHGNLGLVLHAMGQREKAVQSYRRALALKPGYPEAHYNLGNSLKEEGRLQQATVAYRRAIALKPDYAEACNNLGLALQRQRKLGEATAAYQQALALRPDDAAAHYNYATALLLLGDLARGWREYEWRLNEGPGFASLHSTFAGPRWEGDELGGRTVLLHAEQGLGDTLQFIRYAPLVARRGGRVVVQCQPELKRLLDGAAGIERVLARGEPLPPFDLHCPLLSLPLAFGTALDSIPAEVPYVWPEQRLVTHWQNNVNNACSRRIGLVWGSNPLGREAGFDAYKERNSCPLSSFAPLAGVAGVRYYSLQKGEAARQAQHPPEGMELVDLTGELRDFADTAGLLANLDLVISIDTAVAHLAGAMGKPVWLLLRFDGEWRWLTERRDSPWYPAMRIFRQERPGDWDGVLRQVAKALGEGASTGVEPRLAR